MNRGSIGGIPIKEYNRIHKWAERHIIKEGRCFYCRLKTKTEWSNIDHKYRQDKTEWQEVCSKCHKAYDTIHLNIPIKPGRPMSEKTRQYLNRYHPIYK